MLWEPVVINRLPKGLPVQNRNSARLLTSYPCKDPPRPASASMSACVWPEWLGSRAERLTRLPALSQLSHSCQRAINAIYSFIFANLRRRHRWQRQRDTSRCPSNLNIKQPKKAAHACAMRYFLTYSKTEKNRIKNEILLFRLTFLGLRALVSNCQTIAPDYPVGRRLCAVSRLCLIGLWLTLRHQQ